MSNKKKELLTAALRALCGRAGWGRGKQNGKPAEIFLFQRVQTVDKFTGEIANFRQVCRGRINASRAVYPLGRFVGMAATGGIYAAPTDYPQNCHHDKTAGGACPAPAAREFFIAP